MNKCWVEPDIRDEIVDFVAAKKQRCGMSEMRIVQLIGLHRRKFYNWKTAYGSQWNVGGNLPRGHWLHDWEKDAIVEFYLEHECDGYRRCAYMMMDQDIVYAAPATVYSVLKDRGVMRTRTVKKSRKGSGFDQPLKRHEHWHSIQYLSNKESKAPKK